MLQPAVRVEGLSKRYRIGATQRHPDDLRDAIAERFSRARRKRGRPGGADPLWALRDVSFEVQAGDVVGIVGRNGAGKSTLLKILSRITAPTHGRVELRGRLASLLEVGTGFHPELTGRENTYLNGAILGLSRREMDARLDRIIAFAEIERFIDTPVKQYSSGMYVRLGFAVAAHLEPEILVVDEVLAVGDAAFQRKCLARMNDVSRAGRTVLFVSHNLLAVRALCRTALLLDGGRILAYGATDEVVDRYLRETRDATPTGEALADEHAGERSGTGPGRVTAFRTLDGAGRVSGTFRIGEPLVLEADLRGVEPGFAVGFAVENLLGQRLLHLRSENGGLITESFEGEARVRTVIPRLQLAEGDYLVNVSLGDRFEHIHDRIARGLAFSVVRGDGVAKPFNALFYEPGEWSLALRDG